MTRPSVSSDWLMLPASRARASLAPDRPTDSEPARSTRLSLPMRSTSSPSAVVSLVCIVSVNTQCEREDAAFISVSAVARLAMPRCTHANTSSGDRTATSSSPITRTVPRRPASAGLSTIFRRSPPLPSSPAPLEGAAPPAVGAAPPALVGAIVAPNAEGSCGGKHIADRVGSAGGCIGCEL
jgi:hypothetical protein